MPKSRIKELRPWLVWLAGFYAVWISIVFVGNHWQTLVEHWGIALTMAIGSYAAGSTPMGGERLAFWCIALWRGTTLGRDFSLRSHRHDQCHALSFAGDNRSTHAPLGVVPPGTRLSALAPLVSGLFIKVLAVVWALAFSTCIALKSLCSTRAWPQEPIDSTGTRVFWWDCWREPRFRRLPEWAWTWCSTPC